MAASLLGCSADSKPEISGKVTWEGKPVEKVQISFFGPNRLALGAGPISAGTFTVRVKPALDVRVEITAVKPGPVDPAMGQGLDIQYLPPQYNEQSFLTTTVKPSGNETLNFDLKK
jgi:hypothetical protein